YSGVPRKTQLAKTLFAVDELAGLITAIGYVRPNGLQDLSVKSVRKKLKDKAFAAAVSREDILQGAEELGVELGDHIANVVTGMQREAGRLGF
ncbi:MAG TPA: HAD family hydrolase, partial [Rhodothermia bacterium]